MKRWMQIALSLALLTLLLQAPSPVRADAAPPYQPPGSDLQPGGEQTQVRMLAETVQIEVQATTPAKSQGRAAVIADFTMRNLGEEAESMAVRFPTSCNDGYYNYPEITDFVVKVDGTRIPTRRDTTEDPDNSSGRLAWTSFDVTFPPGQDVSLQVTYTLEGTGGYSSAYVSFAYLLETGAGWKDTIGSADIIVRLPYEANPQNIMLEESTGWSFTTPGGVMAGNEVRWHFAGLEPTPKNNIEISLVKPSYWQVILTERGRVTSDPKNGEALGRLGMTYGKIVYLNRYFRQDAAGLELYGMAVQALENAVALLPYDPRWHTELASLLFWHYLWTDYSGFTPIPNSEIMRALQELDQALALAPQDEQVRELADNISYSLPEVVQPSDTGYALLWLTATPTTNPTHTPPLPTATPSATPPPTVPATPTIESFTPTPVQTGRTPPCAASLFAPLAAGLVLLHIRKRKINQ